MALWEVQEVLNETSKQKFEKLYNLSLNNLYADGALGDGGYIPDYLNNTLGNKLEEYSDTDLFPKNPVIFLTEANIKKKLENTQKKSVSYIRGYVEAFDYSENLIDIFNLLDENGSAVITLPATDYPKLFKKIKDKKNIYINALFSSTDDRNDIKEFDKKFLLPIECKCICVVVTRKKTSTVLTCLEYSNIYTDPEDIEVSFNKLFKNQLNISRKKNKLKAIYDGELVVFKANTVGNIQALYITEDLSRASKVKNETKKLSEMAWIQKVSNYHIFALLSSYDDEGSNIDKFRRNIKKFHKTFVFDDDNEGDPVKRMIDMMNFNHTMADYEPNPIINDIKDYLILRQTIISRHEFNPVEVLKPIDWMQSYHEIMMHDKNEVQYGIILLSDEINFDYLFKYLNSYEGQLKQRKALAENDCDIEDSYKEIEIPFFEQDEQAFIISAIKNAETLSEELDTLAKNIIENPKKSKEIDRTLKDWIIKLDKLSLDEKIITLACEGESDRLEYKSTFSLDIESKKKVNYLEHSIFKTIAGFLNSRGGTLLVGVNDSGKIDGINEEIKIFDGSNEDKFLLRFLNKLKSKENFGQQFFPFIEYQLVNVMDKLVLYIKCKEANDACFINKQGQEVFYSRQNPGTIELRGNEMVKYINNRFQTDE